ncbi:MAG: hypothetical protein HY260_04650 [Chloroflexi bacterium]|nr:hypothetical protein [Chloroflexota bacterium]
MTKCALCGYEFEEKELACHSKCPMSEGCAIICCPNCGFQEVDESKSEVAVLIRRTWQAITQWHQPAQEKTR